MFNNAQIELPEDEQRVIWEKIFPTKEKAHDNVVMQLQIAFSAVNKARLLSRKAELDEATQAGFREIMAQIEKVMLPL